ncbi:ankyrin repeat-containing protein-like, partial [Tropilaelaps mercedesae]
RTATADDSDLIRPRKVQRRPAHHLEHHLESLAGGSRGQIPHGNEDIVKTVGDSIRRYRLEHKLFSELQELKRHQIRSKQTNENVLVKRMVDHFRAEVLAPGMRDYAGSYTFREFERYLYGQLRDVATAADPDTVGGSSGPSSSASPLDPSFGHVTATGSSGPSSFHTVTLPPPATTTLPRPLVLASQRTPSPSKQG